MLDTAPLASHLLGSTQHGSDLLGQHQQHHPHHLGNPRDAERELLLHRLSEMEHVLRQQQQDHVQAQQTITKLQAQIILLEERYRLTSDGQDQLGEDGLPQQGGALRQQGLADADGALSPPGALRSAAALPGASAFAAAAASSVTSVLETSSSGGSSSTTAVGPASSSVPSGGGDSSVSSAETHGPWSQGAGYNAFGLNPAPSAPSHLAGAELPCGSLPMLQPSLDALVPPLPTSLSGLSRSLSLSAAAAGTKQPQQHKPRQPGASAGGALGVSDNNSSSEEFVQVRAGPASLLGCRVDSVQLPWDCCCSGVAAKVPEPPCW